MRASGSLSRGPKHPTNTDQTRVASNFQPERNPNHKEIRWDAANSNKHLDSSLSCECKGMNNRLRIGFVSLGDPRDRKVWSGTPYHLLEALEQCNVTVEVLGPLKRHFRYPLMPFKIAARLAKRDVEFDRYPIALRSYARQLKEQIRQRPVDVILSASSVPIAMLECSQPIVFYTDALYNMMPEYYRGQWDRYTIAAQNRGKRQEQAALDRSSIAVYASHWAADEARKLTQPSKVRIVPFGASMAVEHDHANLPNWIEERLSRASTECRLLFIGVDWLRKGGDVAVETARLLNWMGIKTKLTVVGCRPEKKFQDFVEFRGFLNKQTAEGRDELRRLYQEANFFLLPTSAEAAGIVFCEACAHGLPILTFRTGGVPDYVRNGINGMCLPSDSKPEDFARNIAEILKDSDRYTALCHAGYSDYRDRLNWDTAASSLIDLCHEAVQNRRT